MKGLVTKVVLTCTTAALVLGGGVGPAEAATRVQVTDGVVVGVHGSGAQYVRGEIVKRFPARTFVVRKRTDVTVYEDGSGVQYHGQREVRTFRSLTFAWDCRAQGNEACHVALLPLLAECDNLPSLRKPDCWDDAYEALR